MNFSLDYFKDDHRHIVTPGFGTGSGQLPHGIAAVQMIAGIRDALLPRVFASRAEASFYHKMLGYGNLMGVL